MDELAGAEDKKETGMQEEFFDSWTNKKSEAFDENGALFYILNSQTEAKLEIIKMLADKGYLAKKSNARIVNSKEKSFEDSPPEKRFQPRKCPD